MQQTTCRTQRGRSGSDRGLFQGSISEFH